MELSKEELLKRFEADRFATEVTGIEIVDVRPGYAKVKLAVEPRHHNAVGIVQGGVYFTLADFAFAVASNTQDSEATLSIESSISFFKPVTAGTLFAEANLLHRSRSLQSFEVPVTNENGETVALFYGRGFVKQRPERGETH